MKTNHTILTANSKFISTYEFKQQHGYYRMLRFFKEDEKFPYTSEVLPFLHDIFKDPTTGKFPTANGKPMYTIDNVGEYVPFDDRREILGEPLAYVSKSLNTTYDWGFAEVIDKSNGHVFMLAMNKADYDTRPRDVAAPVRVAATTLVKPKPVTINIAKPKVVTPAMKGFRKPASR